MGKPRAKSGQKELFRVPLKNFIDMAHSLVKLAININWDDLEKQFDKIYSDGAGQPPLNTRLMMGLHLLKYVENISDEVVVKKFIENPYYQFFCGNEYFEHKQPCNPSSMTHWRKRVNYKGCEKLLAETVDLALRMKVISKKDLNKVYLDTTVQEKNITFPTDAKLYFKGIYLINKRIRDLGIQAKQSYKFTAKKLLIKYQRYMHAKQFKRAKKCLRALKTAFGRLIRDVSRKAEKLQQNCDKLKRLLGLCTRVFNQKKSDKNKIYSYHAPEVKCIAKGKSHKKYEFGNKVSIATTANKNLVVGVESFVENIYDGKTLADSIIQIKQVTGQYPKEAYVDRGYRGYNGHFMETQIYHQAQRRGVTNAIRKYLKRRSRIEPVIGHLKQDHRLGRNFLLGTNGDKINSILAGCAFNLKKVIRAFELFLCRLKVLLFFETNSNFSR